MRSSFVLLSTALFFGCATAPPRAPVSHAEATEGGRLLRAMTFNIQSGARGLDRVARVILDEAPDLVALQEVDRGTRRAAGQDQARELADRAGFEHVAYFAATELFGGEYGLALLSRHPIVETRRHRLPTPRNLEQRALAHAVLDVEGREVSVYITHLSNLPSREPVRLAQARYIARAMSEDPRPRLLMGDLNDAPQSATLLFLRRHLACAFTARGEGRAGTYPLPGFLPELRLDYVLASAELTPRRAWVVRRRVSDHFPVVAEFELAPAAWARTEGPAAATEAVIQ
jgi:endonuclease/exonuclease/phosphatase family metal-dependent hydrolase